MAKKYNVLGIGGAIVDIISQVEDDFLVKNDLQKNSMKLIDEAEADRIYKQFEKANKSSGGSVANTMAGLSSLGLNVALIGKVKDDDMGQFFADDMQKIGVEFICNKSNSGDATATSIISVTPDAGRTMATFLGATRLLSEDDIDEDVIKNSEIIYLEGYLWDEEVAKKAMLKSAKIAKQNNVKVAFTLSDSFCVNRHRSEFLDLTKNYVDILFSNYDEALALTETKNIEDAKTALSKMCEIVVVTQSEQGSSVIKDSETFHADAHSNLQVVDTTGAGDAYAAGFLYGLSKALNLLECAKIGNKTASIVIQKIGARSDFSNLNLLNSCDNAQTA